MDIGIFDHVDRGASPLPQFFEDRLALIEAYDRFGFYSYHVAEHHFTPLGVASSPSVYLSAVAQRSKQLRFGPMVYCLPLYHPLRLAEEICMLDQMSGGRFDLGVGRGISPLESRSYGENPDKEVSQKVYEESLAIMRKAFSGEKFSYAGQHRRFEDVQMTVDTAQKPHPPLWMGVQTTANADFAARNGMSTLSLLAAPALREIVDTHRSVWKQTQGDKPAKQGVGLFIVVADTEGKAKEIAQRAYRKWHMNFHYLYHLHGRSPVWGERPPEFSVVESDLRGIASTPDVVRDFIKQRVAECGANYVTGQFFFGDMTRAEAMRSVELFGKDVLPALKAM